MSGACLTLTARSFRMTRTLAEWLVYQERVNVRSIELGLDRVSEVWDRMGAPAPAKQVITVGGTNGKGSTVALIEAMLTAAGQRVGAFTSPHLLDYNERIRIDGNNADDASLVASFERIELARGDIPLTYFEFGTLAALDLFSRAGLDVAVLEVGLGGRLDAVNIIDADVAVITTVDLDHTEWLGPDVDSIGREKAGIARTGRPAIVGQLTPPAGLLDTLTAVGALVERTGLDFEFGRQANGWCWRHRDGTAMSLPDPALAAPVQYANAAAAIAALHALWRKRDTQAPEVLVRAARKGLAAVQAPARLQSFGGDPRLVVDVGHNPQAARALAEWLGLNHFVHVHAVYGALADKDAAGVIEALADHVDHWHLASLDAITPRGRSAAALSGILIQVRPGAAFDSHASVGAALHAARAAAATGDCILAFGSFFVASAVIAEQAAR